MIAERQLLYWPDVLKVCGAIVMVAAAGATLLAPLALVLYLISWWGCR